MNIENFYDEFTKKLISDYLYSNPRTEAGIALALHWIPNNAKKILDIGCGIGWTSHEYACKYQNAEILGIDLSANSINAAKTLFNDKNNLSYKKVDVTKNNFADNQKYDVIVMLDVYEHIALPDRKNFIESISKILNPKGIVVFSCPSIYHQYYLKHENPSGLQPVDEDVNIEDIYDFAKKINGDVVFFNYISIWHANDYFHAVIQNDVSLNDSKNKKVLFFDILESKQNRIKRVKQSQYILMFEELLKKNNFFSYILIKLKNKIKQWQKKI
jgi:SAM-dependent methyltransferase